MTKTAWITLRVEPPYRSDAFATGFEALGFTARMASPENVTPKPGDAVIVWNLNSRYRPAAQAAAEVNVPLIVAENGYIPSRTSGEMVYALARNGHNGSGFWFVGQSDRWGTLGQEIRPWVDRPNGYVLVADQRGIGSELMRCPYPLFEAIAPRMKSILNRSDLKKKPELRLRTHPGRAIPTNSLEEDLAGARAVVTWASNVANIALLYGIPAFRLAPYHVNEAVISDLNHLPHPPQTDRLAGFRKMAWAQWELSEISNGKALKWVLQDCLT